MDHELRIVVVDVEVGPLREVLGDADGVEDLVQRAALVHEGQRLVVDRLQQLGGLAERLSDAVATHDR